MGRAEGKQMRNRDVGAAEAVATCADAAVHVYRVVRAAGLERWTGRSGLLIRGALRLLLRAAVGLAMLATGLVAVLSAVMVSQRMEWTGGLLRLSWALALAVSGV